MKNGGKTAKAAKNGKKRWKNGETAKTCEKRHKPRQSEAAGDLNPSPVYYNSGNEVK